MEEYIAIQSDADEVMREYKAIRQVTMELDTGAYPRTKSWFLKKFGTESTPFDMDKAIDEISKARATECQASA